MIAANIDVIDGFVNGAVGTLRLCEYPVDNFPKWLQLQFNVPTTGKLTRLHSMGMVSEARQNGCDVDPMWIPIEPRVATITLDRKTGIACRRKQFPLAIRKSQGGTYSSVVYEYNKTPAKVGTRSSQTPYPFKYTLPDQFRGGSPLLA